MRKTGAGKTGADYLRVSTFIYKKRKYGNNW